MRWNWLPNFFYPFKLSADVLKNVPWRLISRNTSYVLKPYQPRLKRRRIKKLPLILGLALLIGLWPTSSHVIYADPIAPVVVTPAKVKSIPETKLVEQTAMQTIYVPPPVPVGGGASNCGSDPNLAYIYQHESGCCPTKWQGETFCPDTYYPTYDINTAGVGYGLCQSTPAGKMASAGADWATSWATQNAWCTSYANTRYGSTYLAYLHWLGAHNW